MPLFVTCGRGLEPLLLEELSELGFNDLTPGYCGINVPDHSMDAIYTINYRSRIASRVLLPLSRFHCANQDALYRNSKKIDWARFLKEGETFAIDANVEHRSLTNSLFAAQLVKDALCDRLRQERGFRPNVDIKNPDVQFNLFIDQEQAVISLDTSGQPLHKRGYRQATGAAPLQETLAAALLRLARYKPGEVAIDPCCGSGTLLIEAALIATNTAPGYLRKNWGFTALPDFNHEAWSKIKKAIDSQRISLKPGALTGIERDPEVARFCRANIQHAGFDQLIEIFCDDFTSFYSDTAYQFLITNPPHGKRLGDEEKLVSLYRTLGDFMKHQMTKPGRGFIFTTSKVLAKQIGLASKRRHVITCGGLEARLLEFEIY